MNYFEFYDIPVSFKIDESVLKKKYLMKSKKFHPDFYTNESASKQEEIMQLSTLNNQSYLTLKDFDARMKYILELNGILSKNDKSALPQSFLMEMMDLNEALFDLEMDFDDKKLNQAKNDLEDFEKSLESEISSLLETIENKGLNDDILEKIKNYYLKRRYLLRIKKNLNKFVSL